MTDEFYRHDRETRREFATRKLADLELGVDQSDPPEIAARKAAEKAQRMASLDGLFAPGFVDVRGASRPISATLARQLGYEIQQPAWSAGDDNEARDD